jgi:hypothetical protein
LLSWIGFRPSQSLMRPVLGHPDLKGWWPSVASIQGLSGGTPHTYAMKPFPIGRAIIIAGVLETLLVLVLAS